MIKLLKYIGFTLVALLIVLVGVYFWYDEPLPEGTSPEKADAVADIMLENLNYDAWQQIEAIQWDYPGGHSYIWNKQNKSVLVKWDRYEVYLHTPQESGIAFENGLKKEDPELVQQALSYFYNDSFWLIAPFKVKDPGTTRYLVESPDDRTRLMVTYNSGGVTPGDTYLWILDDDFRPEAWKFWVQIVPVGGIEFSWECWENVDGALISTCHDGLIPINISNLKAGSLQDLASSIELRNFLELQEHIK